MAFPLAFVHIREIEKYDALWRRRRRRWHYGHLKQTTLKNFFSVSSCRIFLRLQHLHGVLAMQSLVGAAPENLIRRCSVAFFSFFLVVLQGGSRVWCSHTDFIAPATEYVLGTFLLHVLFRSHCYQWKARLSEEVSEWIVRVIDRLRERERVHPINEMSQCESYND